MATWIQNMLDNNRRIKTSSVVEWKGIVKVNTFYIDAILFWNCDKVKYSF